ncbi:MAG: hypothetical protein SGCHY_001790 [Lobulomycetales sp.]
MKILLLAVCVFLKVSVTAQAVYPAGNVVGMRLQWTAEEQNEWGLVTDIKTYSNTGFFSMKSLCRTLTDEENLQHFDDWVLTAGNMERIQNGTAETGLPAINRLSNYVLRYMDRKHFVRDVRGIRTVNPEYPSMENGCNFFHLMGVVKRLSKKYGGNMHLRIDPKYAVALKQMSASSAKDLSKSDINERELKAVFTVLVEAGADRADYQ